MAGRSSKSDNRGNDLFGKLVSGKGREFHTSRSAAVNDPFSATGGNQSGPGAALEPGNGYKYHFFTASGSLVTSGQPSDNVDYVVVGGGAAGGGRDGVRSGGGGGGAGGYVEATNQSFQGETTYPIVVGAGGAAHTPGPGADFRGLEGTNSTLGLPSPVVAWAGGGGGGFSLSGNPGGSGGGGGQNPGGRPGGNGNSQTGTSNPTPQQGYGGGNGSPYPGPGGGGGGGAGASGTLNSGGDGKSAFSGDTGIPPSYGTPGPSAGRWFAGGGGGQGYVTGSGIDPAGAGGGASAGNNATVNTGGGGGAQSGNSIGYQTSAGSGIVIIRYPIFA